MIELKPANAPRSLQRMGQVYIFISKDRFKTFDDVTAFIHATYDADGDRIPSPFMSETALTCYEPSCIEILVSESEEPISVADLLKDVSYADQWLRKIEQSALATTAICILTPNIVERPERTSLVYLGQFGYTP